MATKPSFSEVMSAIRGQRSRSPAYRWFSDNYGAIAAARAEGGQTDWIRTAAELNRLGVRTADGTKLKGETARRIWARVHIDMQNAGRNVPAVIPIQAATMPSPELAPREAPAPGEFGFKFLKKGK